MAHLLDDAQAANSAESRGVGECLQLRGWVGPWAARRCSACIRFRFRLAVLRAEPSFAGQLPHHRPAVAKTDGAIATREDIEQMVDRHLATRRLQPQGAFTTCWGYSLGGTLAHSMATARLQQQGEEWGGVPRHAGYLSRRKARIGPAPARRTRRKRWRRSRPSLWRKIMAIRR
ncbi:thioesterase domain-containing protein [Serratia ureilytica]